MKNSAYICVLILALFLAPSKQTAAQENNDLNIYGFTQVMYLHRMTDYTIYAGAGLAEEYSQSFRSTSFSLHQMNLFFQKSINERTNFFLNIEASGSYSSRTPSGYLEIPEGWISYRFNDALEVKAGLLLPKFNNLTEIKNRLPLFPYLIRPIMYETLVASVFKSEDYRPDNAYFQLSYYKPVGDNLFLDGAFYIGNSEDSFLAREEKPDINDLGLEERTKIYLGENMNSALLYGARIGVENVLNTFKFGISGTLDEDNKNRIETSVFKLPDLQTPILGEVRRYRLGVDLSFMLNDKIAFETEFIGAFHDHSEIRKTPIYANANLNKFYSYANVTYYFTDKIYTFGGYSISKDYTYDFVLPSSPDAAGLYCYNFGAGWKAIDNTVLKAQFFHGQNGKNNSLLYNVSFLTLGISTIF